MKFVNLDNVAGIINAPQANITNYHFEHKCVKGEEGKVRNELEKISSNKTLAQVFHLARWWAEFSTPEENAPPLKLKVDHYKDLLEFLELSLGKKELNGQEKEKINNFALNSETEYKILEKFMCFYPLDSFNNEKIKDYPYKVFHFNRVAVLSNHIRSILEYRQLSGIVHGKFIYNNAQLNEFLKNHVGSHLSVEDIVKNKPYLEFLLNMLIAHKSYIEHGAYKQHNEFITKKIDGLKKYITKNNKAIGYYINKLQIQSYQKNNDNSIKYLEKLQRRQEKNNNAIKELKNNNANNKDAINGLQRYITFSVSNTIDTLYEHIGFITDTLKKASAPRYAHAALPPKSVTPMPKSDPRTIDSEQANQDTPINLRFLFSGLFLFYGIVMLTVTYLKAKAINAAVTIFGFIAVFSLCWTAYEAVRAIKSEEVRDDSKTYIGGGSSQADTLSPGGNQKHLGV